VSNEKKSPQPEKTPTIDQGKKDKADELRPEDLDQVSGGSSISGPPPGSGEHYPK
jgi:hypothetical protein